MYILLMSLFYLLNKNISLINLRQTWLQMIRNWRDVKHVPTDRRYKTRHTVPPCLVTEISGLDIRLKYTLHLNRPFHKYNPTRGVR